MANLAALRLRFVDVIGRLDFLLNGNKTTNTDNGANDFLQRAVRELDVEAFYLNGGDKNRKFVKVLAVSDFSFTLPEFLKIDGMRMLTTTGEIDMGDGRLDLREFRNRHNRPYADWTDGVPFDWAINDDILVSEQESSIPQSALGQTDTRVIVPVMEMLENPSFVDAIANTVTDSGYAVASTDHRKYQDARHWNIDQGIGGGDATFYDSTNELIDVNGSYGTDGRIVYQDVSNMMVYPDAGEIYTLSIVVDTLDSGTIAVALGDAVLATITGAGTFTREIRPTTYATDSDLRVVCAATSAMDAKISSISLKRIDDADATAASDSIPEVDEESRKGIIFFPPSDEARTVEVYGKFYTPTMTRDTDTNFWSTRLADLIVYKAAELYYADLGNSAREKSFADKIVKRINRLDSIDAQREDNDAAGINETPLRGVPEKWAR